MSDPYPHFPKEVYYHDPKTGDSEPTIIPINDIGESYYQELQNVTARYAGKISNAEAIGCLEMLKIKVWRDTHTEEEL